MPNTKAPMLYFNGNILTMDEENSSVDAIGVVEGKIVSTGSLDKVSSAMPPDAGKFDLNGKTMIPAFIDSHGHFPDSGFVALFRVDVSSPPMGECTNLDHVFRKLKRRIDETPAGEWVMGAAFNEAGLDEKRMPTRDELDAISTDHPIWLIHSSGHCGVANSMALERQNIYEGTIDPIGGRFLRDQNSGLLNGQIEGLSAMGELSDTHFLINTERFQKGFDATREEYLSQGVTLAQNSWAAEPLLELFEEAAQKGDPGIDLIVLPVSEIEPELSNSGLAANWPDNPHIALGPRKLLTDGSFLMRTAYLSEPYFTGANCAEPDCGLPYIDQSVLNSETKKLHDMGFQIHTHCNGDASADMYLDALEIALNENPRKDHRHTIIHGQVLREDQLDRIDRLGVTVSFFTAHVYYWGDEHYNSLLGPERADNISPAASAAKRGIKFTIHNDASVTPTRPLHLISCAVNRLTNSGRILGENQKISALQALRAHTIDAAWQVFRESERGSIEIGKIADFAILSDNPIANPGQISDMKIAHTIRRGEIVYSA